MLRFVSALAVLAVAAASREMKARSLIEARKLTMDQAVSTDGWWGAMVISGDNSDTFCGLRNFPPIPDGYGTARMLCGGYMSTYDHYWMWRITSVADADKPYPSTIVKTGEDVYLSILVPMLPWCGVDNGKQIQCGYRDTKGRSVFTVENMDGDSGVDLDLATDNFYLKSGGLYCSRSGNGNSAYIKCQDSTPKTVFGYKMSSYYKVSISSVGATEANEGETVPCGFNFIPLTPERAAVNCTTEAPYIPSNYATEVFASIKPPGAVDGVPSLVSGANMTFKAHDSLYKYQVSNWVVEKTTKKVVSYDNDTRQPGQWFTISAVGAWGGDELEDGDTITIMSAEYNMYCGVSSSSQIVCDMAEKPTESDTAYLFKMHISSPSTR